MITERDVDKYVKFITPVEPCPPDTIAQIRNVDGEMIIVHAMKLGILIRFDSQEEFTESTTIIEVARCEHCGSITGEKK